MKIVRIILLTVLTIALLILTGGALAAIAKLYPNWLKMSPAWQHFLAGSLIMLAFILFMFLLWRVNFFKSLPRQFLFFHRMNHELVHALAALATFSGVSAINVSASAGSVETGGKSNLNFIVALAPYMITLPLLAAFLYRMIFPPMSMYAGMLLGSVYCYYVLAVLSSVHLKQSDFQHTKEQARI